MRIQLVIGRLAPRVAFALARVRVQVESVFTHFITFASASMRIQVKSWRALASADQRAGSVIDRVALGGHPVALASASIFVQFKVGMASLIAVA